MRISEGGTIFEGELQQAVAAVQFQFAADVGPVRLHRARDDEQLRGDFPAGFIFGDELEYPAFRLGEVFQAGLVRGQRLGAAAPAHQAAGNSGLK